MGAMDSTGVPWLPCLGAVMNRKEARLRAALQRGRRGPFCRPEGDGLPLALLDRLRPRRAPPHVAHDLLDQVVGSRCGRGDPHRPLPRKPRRVDVGYGFDAVGVAAQILGQFQQAHPVAAVAARHDQEHVNLVGDLADGVLTVLGGVAEVVAAGRHQVGESLAQDVNGAHGVVHRQGRLRQHGNLVGVGDLNGAWVGQAFLCLAVAHYPHHGGLLGRLAAGTDDLLVVERVTDQQDVVTLLRVPLGLIVDLGDQRAGGVDRGEAHAGRLFAYRRAYPVGAEDHGAVQLAPLAVQLLLQAAQLAQLLHEVDAVLLLEAFHDGVVVHDGVVDGQFAGAVQLVLPGGLLDCLDCHYDAGAESAGPGQIDALDHDPTITTAILDYRVPVSLFQGQNGSPAAAAGWLDRPRGRC